MARVSPVSGSNSTVACCDRAGRPRCCSICQRTSIVDRLLHELEAVQVLDLAPRAEGLRRACAPRRWRRSGSCLPACCRRRCRSRSRSCAAPWRRPPPRPLERMSGSVTISSSGVPARFRSMPVWPMIVLVQRLAGVFFEVGAHQAHGLLLVAEEELDRAALHHRDLELADLVALGQVGVEVVLAREDAARRDVRADGQAEPDGALDRARFITGSVPGRARSTAQAWVLGSAPKAVRRAAEDLALRWRAGRAFRSRSRLRSRGSSFGRAHVQKPAGAAEVEIGGLLEAVRRVAAACLRAK